MDDVPEQFTDEWLELEADLAERAIGLGEKAERAAFLLLIQDIRSYLKYGPKAR